MGNFVPLASTALYPNLVKTLRTCLQKNALFKRWKNATWCSSKKSRSGKKCWKKQGVKISKLIITKTTSKNPSENSWILSGKTAKCTTNLLKITKNKIPKSNSGLKNSFKKLVAFTALSFSKIENEY